MAAALSGKVKAPASLISDNGGGIISNNGGTVVSNNGGSLVSDHGGGLTSKTKRVLLASVDEVPVAGVTVSLLDAANQQVKGPDGQPITAVTDRDGNYAFASLPADHNLVISSNLGKTGNLTALATKGGGKQIDVDLVSTLTTTYILSQYVSTQKDPVTTLDRLPANVEVDTRSKADQALTAGSTSVPDALTPDQVVATVESLRKSDPSFNDQMETVKKLLILAGQSDLGNGLPGTQVDLPDVRRLLETPDGTLYVVTSARVWQLAADGTLVTAVDGTQEAIEDAGLDGQGRLIVAQHGTGAAAGQVRFQLTRHDAAGTDSSLGNLDLPAGSDGTTLQGLFGGNGDSVQVVVATTTREAGALINIKTVRSLWSAGPGPTASKLYDLPDELDSRMVGRAADGTLTYAAGGQLFLDAVPPGGGTPVSRISSNSTGSGGDFAIWHIAVNEDGRSLAWEDSHGSLEQVDANGAVRPIADGTAIGKLMGIANATLVAIAPDNSYYLGITNLASNAPYTQIYHAVNGQTTLIAGRAPTPTGTATTVPLHAPTSLAAAPDGSVLLLDNGTIRKLAKDGTLSDVKALPTVIGPATLLRTDGAGAIYYNESYYPPAQSFPSVRVSRLDAQLQSSVVLTPDVADIVNSLATTSQGLAAVSCSRWKAGFPNSSATPYLWTLAGPSSVATAVGPSATVSIGFGSSPLLATDPNGVVYANDESHLWRVATDGSSTPVAEVAKGSALAVDRQGRFYIARTRGTDAAATGTIERYDPNGGSTTPIAGAGSANFAGSGVDDGLGAIVDLAIAPDGGLLILDAGHKQLKRIPPDKL